MLAIAFVISYIKLLSLVERSSRRAYKVLIHVTQQYFCLHLVVRPMTSFLFKRMSRKVITPSSFSSTFFS